jgi:diacylglycerol kinase family enzyme
MVGAKSPDRQGQYNKRVRLQNCFALIYNPQSRRNIEADPHYLEQARALTQGRVYAPQSHDELRLLIERMAADPVTCLVIDGGDGTVGSVLSALYASSWQRSSWPVIAVLASGNTNLIAADVGFGQRGVKALHALRDRLQAGLTSAGLRWRRPLVVTRAGHEGQDVLGFFGGIGAFARGIDIAHHPGILTNIAHDAAVALTLMLSLAKLFSPLQRKRWLEGVPCSLVCDGQPASFERHFLLLCTGLQRLPHGAWPFWTEPGSQGDGVAYLDVAARPKRLLTAIWHLLRGRAPVWVRSSPQYRSGMAESLHLKMKHAFVLDGEILEPGADGGLTISAGPQVSFLCI